LEWGRELTVLRERPSSVVWMHRQRDTEPRKPSP